MKMIEKMLLIYFTIFRERKIKFIGLSKLLFFIDKNFEFLETISSINNYSSKIFILQMVAKVKIVTVTGFAIFRNKNSKQLGLQQQSELSRKGFLHH